MEFSKHQRSGKLSPVCWGSGCTDLAVPAASQARASRGCQSHGEMLWGWAEWPHTLNAPWGCAGHTWISPRGHAQPPWAPAHGWISSGNPRRSRAASSKHNTHAALTPQLHSHGLLVCARSAAAFGNIPLNVSQQSLEELYPLQSVLLRGLFSLPR